MLKQSVVRSAISAGLSVLMLAATGNTAQSNGAVQTAPMMIMPRPGQVFQGQKCHGFSNQRAASTIIDQNGDCLVQPDEAAAQLERLFRHYDDDRGTVMVKDEYMALQMRAKRNGLTPKHSKLEA